MIGGPEQGWEVRVLEHENSAVDATVHYRYCSCHCEHLLHGLRLMRCEGSG